MLASNFLVPNATFVVELVAFLIVLALLAKYVLPPLNEKVSERQEVIRQSLVDAEDAKRRAAEAEVDYKKTMEQARAEARAMVEEANKAGEQMRVAARERGEREAEGIASRAQSDIDAAVRRATEDIRREVSGLVLEVVEKVIGEGFTTADHQALIERTIREVETEAAATAGASAPPRASA